MFCFDTIPLSQTNCYLIKTKTGYLLVDCGSTSDKNAFLSNIKRLHIALSDISYLLLTHHHNDHCGLLDFLIDSNPYIRVIMSERCSKYLITGIHCKHVKERYADPVLRLIIGAYMQLDKNRSECFTPYSTRNTDIVLENDNDSILPALGIEGKIFLTPGHTEDSISIITGDTAFIGDAARNILKITGSHHLPILLHDPEVCFESWNKLKNSGAKTLCPAHGSPFDMERLSKFIRKMESRRQKSGLPPYQVR